MPERDRRRSSAAQADTRPAFNRPPGAGKASPAKDSPREKRRERTRDYEAEDSYETYEESPRPKRTQREKAKESPAASPQKKRASRDVRNKNGDRRDFERRHKRKTSEAVGFSPREERERDNDRVKYSSGTSTGSASQLLSAHALSKLNAHNSGVAYDEQKQRRQKKEKQYKAIQSTQAVEKRRRKRNRDVSGAILEEGRSKQRRRRDDEYEYDEKNYVRNSRSNRRGFFANMSARKKWLIALGVSLVVLIVIIAVAVGVSKHKNSSASSGASSGGGGSSSSGPSNNCQAEESQTPASAKGTYTDISTWYDTSDFNCTYTSETVGNLSVMGLYSTWSDSASANSNTPPLDQPWDYNKLPMRGVNLGGWLDLEPFITPSMFNYPQAANVVDEWTLMGELGNAAAQTMEQHYATFITKQDFAEIAAAGLDHVRIPYPYWAVTTYPGDPYVPQIAWRYLLRGIEYARQNGLRVNLDLHCAPGSQNGWAHSGHQGVIGWLNGTDGTLNAQRTIDIHNQLSQFFAQPRYNNVIAIYGLINEPQMLLLDHTAVLNWNQQAITTIRGNGVNQMIAFHDGFLALTDWDNLFKGVDNNLMLDTHQYEIFNVPQLKLNHSEKINVACSGWTGILTAVNNNQTGWGPTFDGEWSQADTDCTPNLNNVTAGSRWAGTYDTGDPLSSVLNSACPTPPCTCSGPNSDPSTWSAAYKTFLKTFAEAQMYSFEQVRGWYYWTWKTENAVQWSWKLGLQAGILPQKAYAPDYQCGDALPDFSGLSEGI